MTNYREIVTGRIVSQKGEPIPGAKIRMYDKDLVFDDHLGSATTGADGRFRIEFRTLDYKHSGIEGRPDIFLKVKSPGGKETRTKVFEELSGVLSDDDSEELMDLGDIAVAP